MKEQKNQLEDQLKQKILNNIMEVITMWFIHYLIQMV